VNLLQATLREMRILHAVFMLTVLLYIYTLIVLHPQERKVSSATVSSFAAESIAAAGLALLFRSRKITPALEILYRDPEDKSALARWRSGNILSFVLTETIVLFGFMLKYLGSGWNVAGVFFVVGTLLFLVWRPRIDVPAGS
jgi:hypothetical protein